MSDSEGDESVADFVCDLCGEAIDKVRYNCSKCEDFDLCEHCFLRRDDDEGESSPHPHKLTQIKLPPRATIMFSHPASPKVNVFVGNFACALPTSTILKKHKIGAVLSILEFPHPNKHAAPLMELFGDDQFVVYDDISYYHIGIPDVANPSLLPDSGNLFAETSTFVSHFVGKGQNVLIHCELGQRRSPIIFLAWLITQGVSVLTAISKFSNGYAGEEGAKWRVKFEASRPKWIERLQEWSKTWSTESKEWAAKHSHIIQSWNSPKPKITTNDDQVIAKPKPVAKFNSSRAVEDDVDIDDSPAVATAPKVTVSSSAKTSKKRARTIDDDEEEDVISNASPTKPLVSESAPNMNEPLPKRQKVEELPSTRPAVSAAPAKPKGGTLLSFFKKA